MKKRTGIVFVLTLVAIMVASCSKEPSSHSLFGDDKKIDIKGSLANGDMRNPNVEAGYWNNTVYVFFHDFLGECIVNISNQHDEVLFADTLKTHPGATTRFFMEDFPNSRYHLVICNDTDKAEGWFKKYSIMAHEVKSLN